MESSSETIHNEVPRSRLEINFLRLFHQTQQMANGAKPKDWTFEKNRRILVLYGSETGTAQEVAERVAREARRRHFIATVSPMNDVNPEQLIGSTRLRQLLTDDLMNDDKILAWLTDLASKENKVEAGEQFGEEFLTQFYSNWPPLFIVFVAATTGQGDDPENMKEFFSKLWMLRQNRQLLKGLHYGVMALGDSSYQKFNYSGKRLNNLLGYLGAESVIKIGLADDQHDLGPDYVVDQWLQEFWDKISSLYPLPDGVNPLDCNALPSPRFKVTLLNENDCLSVDEFKCPTYHYNSSALASADNPCPSRITKINRVTASDHFQDVRLIEFDVEHIKPVHKPGDVLMIQPQNLDVHVEEFLKVLHLDGKQKVLIEAKDTKTINDWLLPQPCTVFDCVKRYFDIMSVPKRYFFELLSFFTVDEDEKEKFLEFSSSKGQQDLYDYCNRPKRSILEILADFPHTNNNIPFEYLFDLIPAMKPRAYSIASSSMMYPGKAQILMAVVKYNTILKRPRLGLCSNWLISLEEGAVVYCWIKKGTLQFPMPDLSNDSMLSSPVIMIGPGTGCAPFRAYIQERVASKSVSAQSPLVLFFGCRNSNKDHFFRQEWEDLSSAQLLELHTAFSRDQEDKVYVQHRIRDAAERLWKLIEEQQAVVYFAGNAKRVPIDVHEALTFVCSVGLGSEDQAEVYMKKNLSKRYQTETWA